MRNSTDEVTLAAPAADPDSIALGLAEMAIDPTEPRSSTVNGRPLYLDSGTADLDDREIDKAPPFDRPDWGICAGLCGRKRVSRIGPRENLPRAGYMGRP